VFSTSYIDDRLYASLRLGFDCQREMTARHDMSNYLNSLQMCPGPVKNCTKVPCIPLGLKLIADTFR